jgi:hypothetical protein
MKVNWSSLSTPDCYAHDIIGEKLTPYANKDENGNIVGYDEWENIYRTRSTVNDETLQRKHIMFLGDSFVYGHGITRGNTVSDYFDKIVSDEYSCFNLGVPGTGIDTVLLRLQQWCNMFDEQVHTVYIGISELCRLRHWENSREGWEWDEEVYTSDTISDVDYSPNFNNDMIDSNPYLHHRAQTITRGYNNVISKVNSVAKLDAIVMAVINLSKAYNFNVYFFSTNSKLLPDEDITVLKEQTENYNVKWCSGKHLNPALLSWTEQTTPEEWDSNYIKNDWHWNAKGCNMVATTLHDETHYWY